MMDPYDKSNLIPKSDLEDFTCTKEKDQKSVEDTLSTIGDALANAAQLLDNLENDGMVGSAIRRYAAELANTVGDVARDLDHGEDDESRKQWARALLDDAHSQLILEENEHSELSTDELVHITPNEHMSAAKAISEISEHDLMNAMTAARSILLDVEDALRNISQDDAEELADVGLAVSKMFLWGLQNIHRELTPAMVTSGFSETNDSAKYAMEIEVLDEYGDNADNAESKDKAESKASKRDRRQRLRILWPPIGPAIGSIGSWGKDAAVKNPILSIVLAMTLWPAAFIGAFIGGPILAADWCLQSSYNSLKDQPILETAEKGAANLYQVGNFYFLVSKLMLKQSIRVGKRQIKRRGGLEQIARDVGDWTIDRALHPIESAGMLWNSAKWSAGVVGDGVRFVKHVATGEIKVHGQPARDGLY